MGMPIKILEEKPVIKKSKNYIWSVKILFITLVSSFCISIFSELFLQKTQIGVSIIILVPLIIVSIIADVLGVAVASCSTEKMQNKYKKSKYLVGATKLVSNAEKISSICNDVIGDVCSIISGAIGSNLTKHLILGENMCEYIFIFASLISAFIAGITVFGKAVAKKYAIVYSEHITFLLARVIYFFIKPFKIRK